jgi:hypothetical protein
VILEYNATESMSAIKAKRNELQINRSELWIVSPQKKFKKFFKSFPSKPWFGGDAHFASEIGLGWLKLFQIISS